MTKIASSLLLVIFTALVAPSIAFYGTGCAPRSSYDYIIVGGGASGSVAARRISDDPRNFTVLVLEAGFPSQASVGGIFPFGSLRYTKDANGQYVPTRSLTAWDVPGLKNLLYGNGLDPDSLFSGDWNIGSNYAVYQGKVLGGSGVHCGTDWVRPSAFAVNNWNVTGWTFDDLLPYYQKSENASYAPGDPALHGYNGPIPLLQDLIVPVEGYTWVNACSNAGYGYLADVNGPVSNGCCILPNAIAPGGIRASALNQYLAPVIYTRKTLDTIFFAQAIEILFKSGSNPPQATGIKYVDLLSGQTYEVNAAVEVILASGALNTPKLLYLSGVGPEDQLRKWNISVKINSPNVGRNIRNNIRLNLVYNSPKTTNPDLYDLAAAQVTYAQTGTGYYLGIGSSEAYLKSNSSLPTPDLQLYILPTGPILSQQQAISVGLAYPYYADGYINLTSTDPLKPPYHYQPIFKHQEDINALIGGIGIVRKIMSTPPASTFFGTEVSPGANVTSVAALTEFIMKNGTVGTVSHFLSSCAMGNTNNPKAVVNPELQLIGASRLRIIDASVIPGALRFAPHPTVIAVAEKASVIILAAAPASSSASQS